MTNEEKEVLAVRADNIARRAMINAAVVTVVAIVGGFVGGCIFTKGHDLARKKVENP